MIYKLRGFIDANVWGKGIGVEDVYGSSRYVIISDLDRPVLRLLHGDIVTVHIVEVYVPDALPALYGFATEQGAAVFRGLLSVKGVGPSRALSILSVLTPEDAATADAAAFAALPGIGPKTAAKIVEALR